MRFIVHRRLRAVGISGPMNLPFGTVCECEKNNVITKDGKQLMFATSENAHQYIARDDDGCGILRGRLTQAIQKRLERHAPDGAPDTEYDRLWALVWEDPLLRQFKAAEFADFWLWNHSFFNAEIADLRYIAKLLGIKEETCSK